MFEKSLYDLIRGLRNHKGNEKEYIQNCLKECRSEIRSQDMDLKATALLKLVYLEMVGHDMSWASFHVLEVMSSQKYHQKRVGYLAAVQSFRPDTEVLMLATNLLKKDLGSSTHITISLPIAALPHIITPSLALSLLADLLPRLSHSQPAIRKKTIVTLYRMALVYPETLRAAWPKIKERLMDKREHPSVTAATVNVVCELGWRRPNDFLPLAPRLFELLVDGGNNWMAIKLIKLFAVLTPLEPRLVRKLLPPLTDLIRTTPAMSLLYECIHGIIQGGILGESEDVSGREEIAQLCVNKLRGMIMVNSDPNLKYVALLAFNRIVVTHPFLVSQQEDVIMECIDSEDITIRIKALDLVQGMVSSDNLVSIVSRLMRQLKPVALSRQPPSPETPDFEAESDEEKRLEQEGTGPANEKPPLPTDYTVDVMGRVLHMCSLNNYANLVDFDWYIDILTQLVRLAPVPRRKDHDTNTTTPSRPATTDIAERVGDELRNVAVKVRAVRHSAVRAAEVIFFRLHSESSTHPVVSGALKPVAWLVGECVDLLSSPEDTLGYTLQIIPRIQSSEALAACLQAAMKMFASVAGDGLVPWTSERKSRISLLMARVINVFEPLALHPSLEVQERAVEFIELLKLTAEAASGQPASTDGEQQPAPLLLTQAIPSLFRGWELNSVAPTAQSNVPIPIGLDLDEPIHPNLSGLLAQADSLMLPTHEEDDFDIYYNQKPPPASLANEPAFNRLADAGPVAAASSYQQAGEDSYLDADIVARRKAERLERNRDDPFYIGAPVPGDRSSTPIHSILQSENGPDLDIDSIPIMQLDLGGGSGGDALATSAGRKAANTGTSSPRPIPSSRQQQPAPRQRVVVAADEMLGDSGFSTPRASDSADNLSDSLGNNKSRAASLAAIKKAKQHSFLRVDSSHLGSLILDGDGGGPGGTMGIDAERQKREEAEMAQAMREVERLRLEMQRANERIQVAQGVPVEGTVVKQKKKKKAVTGAAGLSGGNNLATAAPGVEGGEAVDAARPKKKKKKATATASSAPTANEGTVEEGTGGAATSARVKKKTKRVIRLDGDAGDSGI